VKVEKVDGRSLERIKQEEILNEILAWLEYKS
jgi:hypothetical protein